MDEFRFWYFENELDGLIYGIFAPLNLCEVEITIDISKQKEYAYAHDVSWKCTLIREGLASLQILQKMLNVSKYPIDIGNNKINRHEWYRITFDLVHYRLTSLRDYAFQLVNAVFELGLEPLQIKFIVLKKRVKGDIELINIIDQISQAGRKYRDNRNLLAHEGIYEGINHVHLEMYKAFAMFEENLLVTPPESKYEYFAEYDRRFCELLIGFIPEADNLNKLLNELGDYLSQEFIKRYYLKRKMET
jgi:hypothetical protein